MAIEISAAMATLRLAAGVAKESGKIELYQEVLELQQGLQEAVTHNTELAEKNHTLSERVRELEAEAVAREAANSLEFDGQVYWRGECGDPANGPFCPRCRDKDRREAWMTDRGNGFSCCVACDFSVSNEDLPYPTLGLSAEWDSGDSGSEGW
jgi:hypothetical protein